MVGRRKGGNEEFFKRGKTMKCIRWKRSERVEANINGGKRDEG